MTAYNSSTKVATVNTNWTTPPASGTTYRILRSIPTVKITGDKNRLVDSYITVDGRQSGTAVQNVGILIGSGDALRIENVRFLGGSSGSNAKAMVIQGGTLGTLSGAVIDCHVQWMSGSGGAVDLYDGTTDRIDKGNRIWITHAGDMNASNAVQLAPTWLPETDSSLDATDKLETNEVYINGVRYYREGPT